MHTGGLTGQEAGKQPLTAALHLDDRPPLEPLLRPQELVTVHPARLPEDGLISQDLHGARPRKWVTVTCSENLMKAPFSENLN